MEPNLNTMNPRLMELEDKALLEMQDVTSSDSTSFILDREWGKNAFMISDSQLGDRDDISNRYKSTASAKFTDTRMGCNKGVNARPQFTRYADVRDMGRLADRNTVSVNNTSGNIGMGRYYSEAIDDPAQTIYLTFGVPQFNSLTNFLAKAFDPNQTSMARTGRAPSIFYQMGEAVGSIAPVVLFPAIALTIIAGRVINSFFVRPTSKFYTLKPTMHLYWSTVTTLVNTIAVNRGILPKFMNPNVASEPGSPYALDQNHLSAISKLLPDTFGDQNYFDVMAMANKAQRLSNELDSADYEKLNEGTASDYAGYLKKGTEGGAHPTRISNDKGRPTLAARVNEFLKIGYYQKETEDSRLEVDPRIDPESPDGSERKDPTYLQSLANHMDAEFRGGSQYAVFKVDHTGSVSESFGNSVVESDLSQKLNGISSQIREARFSFADGNLVADDGIGGMVKGALGAVKDVAMGALDGASMGFSGLIAGLGGSGFLDIPKHWQSSTATLPRSSYTMQLISPYQNPISQMQNIYMPLAMLLAGCLPLSTGKQSYTSPFLCQLFDQGRCQVRLGMIESLSITRGTSNLAFDLKGNALALDVTFSIVDLSSVMHMPVSNGKLLKADMTLDEDNILSDYLAVLAGQDMYSQIYSATKAQLNFAKQVMSTQKLTSPAYMASLFHESSTAGSLKYLTFGAFNALEGLVRGSGTITSR